jgi:hypothetical protein
MRIVSTPNILMTSEGDMQKVSIRKLNSKKGVSKN